MMNAMREPNKNYVYSLEDLTSEERKKLYEHLCNLNEELKLISVDEYDILEYKTFNEWCYWYKENSIKYKYTTHNAKELFYTLENVQIDCRELTEEQINEMTGVIGDKLSFFNQSFDLDNGCVYFSFNKHFCLFGFYDFDKEQYEITYEKFMELFGGKEESNDFVKETSIYDDMLLLIEKGKQQGLKVVVTFEKL